MSEKCQKSVTKDFEIFPGGNGGVRLAVILAVTRDSSFFEQIHQRIIALELYCSHFHTES